MVPDQKFVHASFQNFLKMMTTHQHLQLTQGYYQSFTRFYELADFSQSFYLVASVGKTFLTSFAVFCFSLAICDKYSLWKNSHFQSCTLIIRINSGHYVLNHPPLTWTPINCWCFTGKFSMTLYQYHQHHHCHCRCSPPTELTISQRSTSWRTLCCFHCDDTFGSLWKCPSPSSNR